MFESDIDKAMQGIEEDYIAENLKPIGTIYRGLLAAGIPVQSVERMLVLFIIQTIREQEEGK